MLSIRKAAERQSDRLSDVLAEEFSAMRGSLNRVAEAMSGAASDVTRNGSSALGEGWSAASRWLGSDTTREAKRMARRGAAQAEVSFRDLQSTVSRHPVAALSVALLVGFTLGLASHARRT